MADEKQSWFYFYFLLALLLYPPRPSRPRVPFTYSFIQVISHSHLYRYLLAAFNRIHARLLSLEIINKGISVNFMYLYSLYNIQAVCI